MGLPLLHGLCIDDGDGDGDNSPLAEIYWQNMTTEEKNYASTQL